MKSFAITTVLLISLFFGAFARAEPQIPYSWEREWPRTDFSKSAVDFSEIMSGGPPRDAIPAIDRPAFIPAADATNIGDMEPVFALATGREARAYPLRILIWHEIVNDTIGGVPLVVTYCPLCGAALVFDRRASGRVLDFGVSGKLRHSDMVMYDRQTESWWQQATGEAIVGAMTGTRLTRLPARLMPFSAFRTAYPGGAVLVATKPGARPYGENPYVKYDSSRFPTFYRGNYDGPGSPLSYVISVGDDAWLLEHVRQEGRIEHRDLVIAWRNGMNAALDTRRIDQGRDIGFVTVRRKDKDGQFHHISHDMMFAFAFKAFRPEGVIHMPPAR